VIDLHCHVLPGIDDGPSTIDDSLALARAAAAAGTGAIVATPHASARYPNGPAAIRQLVAELNERLRADGTAIEVHTGAEIAMTYGEDLAVEDLAQMTLGGGPWLLLEPPFLPVVLGLDRLVARLQADGYGVVLAHPERCPAFHRDTELLRKLVAAGALTSITAGSLVGRFGKDVKRFAARLIAEDMVHNVASDAHDALRRPPSIAEELTRAGLGLLAGWLTEEVPQAVISASEIPPRPRLRSVSGPRRRLAWRGRRP
jgi:protein-tyrosine phosphatase